MTSRLSQDGNTRKTDPAFIIVCTGSGQRVAVPLTGDPLFDRLTLAFALRGGELLEPADRELGRAA